MKKKLKIGGLKIKITWKNERLIRLWKEWIGANRGYTLPPYVPPNPEVIRRRKIYRIFKNQYCEFFPGKVYGINRTQRSSYIYYRGCTKLGCERCLIGELMFGENKEDFFERKGIFIEEDIHEYRIIQGDTILARYDKEWIEAQGTYQ